MKSAAIAVIVPAKNASATLRKCLDSLLSLDYDNYEIIIVDDGSCDDTPQILDGYEGKIKSISLKRAGPSRARNIAVYKTGAEYIAFTDSDCIVDEVWLRELLNGFTGEKIAAVGGRQEIPGDETAFGRKVFEFMKKMRFFMDYMRTKNNAIISVNHNPAYNVMYRKDIFLKAQGFLEGLWPGEDVELDYRLKKQGYQLRWNPKAVVYHYKPSSLAAFTNMMCRYGYAQGCLVRKYGIFRKIQLLPFIFSGASILFLGVIFPEFPFQGIIFFALGLLGVALYFKCDSVMLKLFILALWNWHYGFIKGLLHYKRSCPR